MTSQQTSLTKWVTGVAAVVAAMAVGGWVNDQRRDAAETVILADLRADFTDLKQSVAAGDAQVERNSSGRYLAGKEETLRMIGQIERRLDRLEDGKR